MSGQCLSGDPRRDPILPFLLFCLHGLITGKGTGVGHAPVRSLADCLDFGEFPSGFEEHPVNSSKHGSGQAREHVHLTPC